MTDDLEPDLLEENTARLLEAALGPDALPRPQLRRQTLGRLLAEVRARRAQATFPDAVVVLLGGLLALAVCGLGFLAARGGASAADPALLLLAAGVACNLVLMPMAGIVIVVRRQHEQTS